MIDGIHQIQMVQMVYIHLCTSASHACKRERLATIQYQLVKVTHSCSTPVTSIPMKNPQTQVQRTCMCMCLYSTCIYMYVYMYCHGLCKNNVHVHNIRISECYTYIVHAHRFIARAPCGEDYYYITSCMNMQHYS